MSGLVDFIFGGSDTPEAPKQQITTTGQMVGEKAAGTLDEEADAKKGARQVARKGTTQFRIPLAAGSTGAKVSSGTSGLKI
jgi:hypothetical protein